MLAAAGNPMTVPAICGVSLDRNLTELWPYPEAILLAEPLGQAVLGWSLMLSAMMPPLLRQPLAYLWEGRATTGRCRASGLFLLGYGGVWMLVGFVLMPVAIAIDILASDARFPAVVAAGLIALAWQTTPVKQAALQSCQRRPPMALYGPGADRDCLRYGVSTAVACFGACWALMLVPLAVHRLDCLAMAIVAAILLIERQAPPRRPAWGCPVSRPMRRLGCIFMTSKLGVGRRTPASMSDLLPKPPSP